MKRKDYEPIKFEIFQSDMEHYMHLLDEAIGILNIPASDNRVYIIRNRLQKMRIELQHRIDMHIRRGEWI